MKNPARFIIISLLASSLSIQAHSSELSLGKHNTIVVSNGKKKVGFAPRFLSDLSERKSQDEAEKSD